MSFEKAQKHLLKYINKDKILVFSSSSATVELAAAAVGCEPARIAKTLSFKVLDECVLIVMAGDAKIDNKKFKNYFHIKAKMLTPDEALSNTGHAVGGVCPFGVPDNVKVYLDESLKRFSTVFPACGSANSAAELSLDELCQASGSLGWVNVCKLIEIQTD